MFLLPALWQKNINLSHKKWSLNTNELNLMKTSIYVLSLQKKSIYVHGK